MTIDSLIGGGYLLSHFRSTIGVVRLNFSVRNGKRWDPHAMTTLFLYLSARTAHLAWAAAVLSKKDHRGNATRENHFFAILYHFEPSEIPSKPSHDPLLQRNTLTSCISSSGAIRAKKAFG